MNGEECGMFSLNIPAKYLPEVLTLEPENFGYNLTHI